MRIAAIGRTSWLYHSIKRIHEDGHDISLIVTTKGSPEYSRTEEDFLRLADEYGCECICDSNLINAIGTLKAGRSDVAISVNWPTIIPASILELFPHGILNAHAGDLPRYRGNACPNWAILLGEHQIALTIHEMSGELDSGAVYSKRYFSIDDTTYISHIYEFLEEAIPDTFAETLNRIERDSARPTPQPRDPRLTLRCLPRRPEDNLLNWSEPATWLARVVRASAEPFPGAYTYLDDRRMRVWRARARTLPCPHVGIAGQVIEVDATSGHVSVLAGSGALILEEVQVDTERVPAAQIMRSTRCRLGNVISPPVVLPECT